MTNKEEEVRIRSMEPGDLDAILVIDRKITGLKRAITYGINELIGGQFELSFVSEVNGEIIGFVLASVSYAPDTDSEVCIIQTIGVDPDYWRKGIASKLIQALLNATSSKRIKMARVMVDQDDKQLCGFFKHSGFENSHIITLNLNLHEAL